MRRWLPGLLAAAVLVCLSSVAQAREDPATVLRVIDGDTIEVSVAGTVQKVRLIGLSAPKASNLPPAAQELEKKAREFVSQLLRGKKVILRDDPMIPDRDPCGHLLRYVYAEDETLLNREVVRRGYGRAYTRYPFNFIDELRTDERLARGLRAGLWGHPLPSPGGQPCEGLEARAGEMEEEAGCYGDLKCWFSGPVEQPYEAGVNGVSAPVPIKKVPPQYPAKARLNKVSGQVVLEAVVRKDGTVGQVVVIRTPGREFEEAAIEAVKQWRYSPALKDGKPVDVFMTVVVDFVLQ